MSMGPRSGSARQMRARAGHADAFFYLKGVQLSATHGAAAATVAQGSGPGPDPGPRAPIRLVSSRKRAVVGHPNVPRHAIATPCHATLFIVGKHARQRRLLFAIGPHFERVLRAPAFCNDGPGNLLGMLPGARVFWIINPFKYRLWRARGLRYTYISPF